MSVFTVSTFNHQLVDKFAEDLSKREIKSSDTQTKVNNQNVFKMILPPPNITGTMHLGHSLTITIQDMMARYHKLKGDQVVWIPGVDHAGIATQVVVEKQLMRDTKQTRHDLGRDKFLEKVWEWKEKNSNSIINQLRVMSPEINYELEQFTMSPDLSEEVTNAFIELYKKGLIFRDLRMVDYCCSLKTVISNIEVDEIEVDAPTKYTLPDGFKLDVGYMYEIKYPIDEASLNDTQKDLMKNRDMFVVVSTTRPETLFGDVAVAVNPNDERYKGLEGVRLILPLTSRTVPLIYDDQARMDMGTGAVKITPAHDPKDYLCWMRCRDKYNLAKPIDVIDDTGLMNTPDGIEYHQKHRYVCRKLVLKKLEEFKLLINTKPHKTTLRVCSRSGDILEPRLKHQWYVDTDDMSKRSLEAVEKGDLVIMPDPEGVHRGTWNRYLSESRPWCISRQLWWGHRIPAYCLVMKDSSKQESEEWFVDRSFESVCEQINKKYPDLKLNVDYTVVQDDDVLDTWFSSGLYPFTVLKGKYFPLDVLETGKDILFFWVARMVMLSLALKDQLPFKTVYLHNVVRDKDGKKMSKSLGNIIDPLDIIYGITRQKMEDRIKNSNLDEKEINRAIQNIRKTFPNGIADYGVDSLRMGLIYYLRQSTDINLDVSMFKTSHAILNKLWNVMMMYELYRHSDDQRLPNPEFIDNEKDRSGSIINSLFTYIGTLESRYLDWSLYEKNDFSMLYENIQQYVMNHYCPFYLEFIKFWLTNPKYSKISVKGMSGRTLNESILDHFLMTLTNIIAYLHPIAPNVTSAIFNRLLKEKMETLDNNMCNIWEIRKMYNTELLTTSTTVADNQTKAIELFDEVRNTVHKVNSSGSYDQIPLHMNDYRDVIVFMTKGSK